MRYLADTTYLSELLKERPNAGVIRWMEAEDENEVGISVLTIGEIQRGISRLPPGDRGARLQIWLDGWVLPRFSGRIFSFGVDEALVWGRRSGLFERQGRPRPTVDSMLAVTALVHGLAVVTRNVRDFSEFDVEVINPWDE